MKIFIDFDDVLFNTKEFIADMQLIFYKHGISKDDFAKTYSSITHYSVKSDRKMRTYDPYLHFKQINQGGINTEKLERGFRYFLKNTNKYIFKDVSAFLKNVERKEIFILSFGTNKFQKEKIKNSGINKFFNKIIVSNHVEKGRAIKKIIGESKEKFYFIDDRVEFLREVKNRYPFAETFLIRRKEGRYKDRKNKYCDHSVNNLEQVLKIIKKDVKKQCSK